MHGPINTVTHPGCVAFKYLDIAHMGETVVDGVCLTCGTLSYEDCHAKLEEVYGAPVEEKVDKSGQTAQGDVTYAVFQNGEHEVWLSKGTEEDFIRLEVY